MKEMLYIPLFFEDGKPLGFHVEVSGNGKYLDYLVHPDGELDQWHFEQLCNRLERDEAFARLKRITQELICQEQFNIEDFETSYSMMFTNGHGITRDGLVHLLLRGLLPHWNKVAEFIGEFRHGQTVYDASSLAHREFDRMEKERVQAAIPAWKRARLAHYRQED